MENSDKKPSGLKAKQTLAVFHLSQGRSLTQTAKRVGVTRQTIGLWMKDPLFAQALADMRTKQLDELLRMHQNGEYRYFEVLTSIMNDSDAHDRDRIRAAVELRNESHRLQELRDFMERLADLEEFVKDLKKDN